VSWANTIVATTPFEVEEIVMNPLVAELFGLREGVQISCSVLPNAQALKTVTITLTGDDYQMAELSTERISNDLLDQITVVAKYQPLIIWLNKSISVKAVVGKSLKLYIAHSPTLCRVFARCLLLTLSHRIFYF
jgi:Peroxisome biogenesis factor 1, N-terminal